MLQINSRTVNRFKISSENDLMTRETANDRFSMKIFVRFLPHHHLLLNFFAIIQHQQSHTNKDAENLSGKKRDRSWIFCEGHCDVGTR